MGPEGTGLARRCCRSWSPTWSGDWGIVIGRGLPGGSASYVARARCADGSAAVIKIAVPDDGWTEQVATLERADGAGYVRLLRSDPTVGPCCSRSWAPRWRPVAGQLRTSCAAWPTPSPSPGRMPPGVGARTPARDKASRLGSYIARGLAAARPAVLGAGDRPGSGVRGTASGRSRIEAVVVHGDPHPGNLLAVRSPRPGADSGYVFVDPDGFVADRAYDLGVAMRDWSERLLGPGRPPDCRGSLRDARRAKRRRRHPDLGMGLPRAGVHRPLSA